MTLEQILSEVPILDSKRDYWFVRTEGGSYYDTFLEKGFIAIGWNPVSMSFIHAAKKKIVEKDGEVDDVPALEALKRDIHRLIPDEKRPGYIASQLLRFAYEIKKGDVVIIPDNNSNNFAFGEVVSSKVFTDNIDGECLYFKRKQVKWLKTISRRSLNYDLFKIIYTHHAISSINNYSEEIDTEISQFYIKGDEMHFALDVKSNQNISANSLFYLGADSLSLFKEFLKNENIDYDVDSVDVKLELRSPGLIEFFSENPEIFLIFVILLCLAGMDFKQVKYKDGKIKESIELRSVGIIKRLGEFISERKNSKKLRRIQENLDSLSAMLPPQLVKALEKASNDEEE